MSRLGLFPLRTVLLPGAALRLHIFEDRYKSMIGGCIDSGEPFGVLLDRNATETGPDLDPVDVGTTARIGEVTRLAQGRLFIVTRGERRFRVARVVRKRPFWTAEVAYIDEPADPPDSASLRASAAEHFKDYLRALLALFGRELESVQLPDDATAASYLIADALQVDVARKQALLEARSAADRLRVEIELLEGEATRLRELAASGGVRTLSDGTGMSFPARFSVN